MEEYYKTPLTFRVFPKKDVTTFWHLISQTNMFPYRTENALLIDHEWKLTQFAGMKFLKVVVVTWDDRQERTTESSLQL